MTEVNGCVTWEMMQMYILQLQCLKMARCEWDYPVSESDLEWMII